MTTEPLTSIPLDVLQKLAIGDAWSSPTGWILEAMHPGLGYIEFPMRKDTSFRLQRKDATFKLPPASKIDLDSVPDKVYLLDPDSADYVNQLALIQASTLLYLDIETFGTEAAPKGLHPYQCRIRLIQLYCPKSDRIWVADFGGRGLPQTDLFALLDEANPNDAGVQKFAAFLVTLRDVAARIPIAAHNIQFDALRLQSLFGIEIKHPICTFIGARVFFGDYGKDSEDFDQRAYKPVLNGGYSLKNLADRCLGINLSKKEQVSDWGADTLDPTQVAYAAIDVLMVYHLHRYLKGLYRNQATPLYSRKLIDIWMLESQFVKVLIDAQLGGIPFDAEECDRQFTKLTKIKQQLLGEWVKLSPSIGHNQDEKLLELVNRTYGLTLEELDKSALADYDYPLLKLRLELKGVDAVLNNVIAFKRSATAYNGRIRTMFRSLTGFGRSSSGGGKDAPDLVNMQSIVAKANPRVAHLNLPNPRKIVASRPGKSYLIVDLAGAHARIAANESQDELAIAGCNDESVDNHSKVAVYVLAALGKQLTWEQIAKAAKKADPALEEEFGVCKMGRDTAKNTFYGWLNGGGAKRIQTQIAANTGNKPPLEACEAAIAGCKNLFPNVLTHRKGLHRRLEITKVMIDDRWFIVNHTRDGARIIQHMEYDEVPYTGSLAAIWSRIEATAIKRAAIRIAATAPREWELQLTAIVHDELDYEVQSKHALEAATFVNDIIGDAFAAMLDRVSDGREHNPKKLICKSWADK